MEGTCSRRRGHARFRRSKVTETCDPLDSFHDHNILKSNYTKPINLNVEPGLMISSKNGGMFDLDLDLNVEPGLEVCLDLNLNVEPPGSSSKTSSVCLDLSSNQKPSSIFHQNPNIVEHGSSSKTSSLCLDYYSSSNQNMSKRFVPVPVSNRNSPFYPYSQYHYQQRHNPTINTMSSVFSSVRPMADPVPHSFGLKKLLMCSSGFDAPRSSCHCCETTRRDNKLRKTIIVPAISNKMSDIPQDAYSWRKYGQKPIKNSHHPRGYYKCSFSKECPAKKWVERCNDEPTKLRITYQNNHNHPIPIPRPHP